MSFLSLAILCLLLPPVRRFLLSLLFPPPNKKENDQPARQGKAEIDGGVWERLSVFEHVEQGLGKSPNGPAVICMFQPADALHDILYEDGEQGGTGRPNGTGIPKHPDSDEARLAQPPQQHVQNVGRESSGGLWGCDKKHPETPGLDTTAASIRAHAVHPHKDSACLTISYKQLHRTALRLAAGILANGGRAGSRMVMFIPNGGEYAILLWTCILLRVTYVSLEPDLLDISGFTALKHMLKALRPQIVVVPDVATGRAIDVAVAELKLPQPVGLSLAACPGRPRAWKSLADVIDDAARHPVDEDAVVGAARRDSPDRIHSIMFTSGTSGMPKGCPMRVGGMSHVLHSQSWLLDEHSGAAALMQPHNSRGIAPAQTLQTWKAGGAVVMTGQAFDAVGVTDAIRHLGVTFIVLTPAMVHDMATHLAAQPVDVGSVRRIQVGGDAVTKGVLSRCAALFPQAQVCVNHGMTEGGGSFIWPFLATPVSSIPFYGEMCPIGAVAPGSIVRIWDPKKMHVVGRGELGELHISSPSLIRHYLQGRSDDSFYHDASGTWFNTGDVAMADKEGLVFILGRRKDMIERAGVPVMPAAIESSVEAFTGAQTIVVPSPHPVLGAEPFAVLSSYHGKTKAEIKDHVRTALGEDYALGGLATLKQLGLLEFPLNPTHKVIKSEVHAAVLQYLKRTAVDSGLENKMES